MPTKNFLELDINKLFEEHNVKEIEQIQKSVQLESDRKKIELRTLVGERYRDLIQAADTIAEMRETSKNVIKRIADIESTFRDLQQKYLIGFKIKTEDTLSNRNVRNISDSVVMQIKILMDVPEHIWSAIDNRDFLLASQLFILARHINFSLTFEVGQATLAFKYPIVSKQWSVIGNFRNVIFNECNATLKSLDLPVEVAANCLASLHLLDGTTSKDLLEKLIFSRSQAIESIIQDESPYEESTLLSRYSVRHRIKLSVKLLTETVILIHSCFTKNNETCALVEDYVKKLTNQEAIEILRKLDLDVDLLEKFLPEVTKSHKPFSKDQFVELSETETKKILESWQRWIENLASDKITKLLSLVTSVRGIYNIREESIALETPENWEKVTEGLSISKKNFWLFYYQPILTNRVKEIVEEKWRETLKNLKSSLSSVLAKIGNEKYEYPENDLRWYVWKDSTNDIPQRLGKSGQNSRKSLLMKSRGFSPNLIELCDNFDKSLSLLLGDLEQYLYETEKSTSMKENLFANLIFEKFVDRPEIQENLRETSSRMIESLLDFVKHDFTNPETNFGSYETNLIFLARFLQALTSLSPNLNKCFAFSKISGHVTTNVKWQSICDRLRDESTKIWSSWAQFYRKRMKNESERSLRAKRTNASLVVENLVSEWEKVTIEEEAEEGKSIKSEILVPYRASVDLQKFLANVTRDLNKIVPHTLPRKVMNEIIDYVATELFENYDDVAKNSNSRQKQAFQVLFDVKYVTLLMVPRENKNLMDRSTEVSNNILSKIDPFDIDVFYPFIHTNVKKSVQRSLLIFGNLVPHMEQLHSVLGSRGDYSSENSKSTSEPPGGLAVCTGAPWFPPLAVTAPTRNLPLIAASIPDKTQRKKTPVKETKNDFAGASIKSGAAAFFGAMGTDWFSTG